MRIASETQLLEVAPGDVAAVVVEVVNTAQVIDGVSARVIGLPDETVRSLPALLPLFPDTTGQLTLSLTVPPGHPAGRHPLTVEVVSHGSTQPSQYLDIDLDVAPRPAMTLAARPRAVRAHRQGRFVLEVANTGNLPLLITPRAVDVDRAVEATFAPTSLQLPAGAVAPILLTVRGPRMLFGAEVDRALSVELTATRIDADADPDAAYDPDDTRSTVIRLRQRPRISRGLLTALILAGVVALWAAVFLLGLNKVFAGDPTTKAVPASFFAADAAAGGASGGASPGAGGSGDGAAAAAPAGALPKNGQVPAGVGGTISGVVTAASNHKPVGRILVQALRQTRDGPVVVSSAATQTDGSYTLAGLFPTQYVIKFAASGYRTVWYPAAAAQGGAQQVSTAAQGATTGVNAVVTGLPATVAGKVDPGNSLTPVITTVVARPLEGSGSGAPIATAKTAADGSFKLTNLPAPGSYEFSFTAPGYQPTTLVDTVAGGQQRLEPTVQLAVGTGQISGTVTDGSRAIGGVTVSTTVGGKPLTVATPTAGTVGTFVLGNLPTPATYVITYAKAGYGTMTTVVDLAAGQSRPGVLAVLQSGTGSVSGQLTDVTGAGLGGATVTVGGASVSGGGGTSGPAPTGSPTAPAGSTAPSTTTLTSGQVGAFVVNGLSAPGSYTLTFTLAGYAPATVPVTLAANGAPPQVHVTLAAQLGRIQGTVTVGAAAVPGVTVTATDGRQVWTTTTVNTGGGLRAGGFLLDALQPGTYTVTATAVGGGTQTALVVVTAGATATQNFGLG